MNVHVTNGTLQIKVTLKGIKPPVWRRLLVPGAMKLSDFHRVLQSAMGWQDMHLHQFTVGRQHYGIPEKDWPDDILNEHKYRICDLLTAEQETLLYEYDFGDGWEHQVLLEKVLPCDPRQRLPLCLKGKRACPPEDVGGPCGYREFLDASDSPAHPEHLAMRQGCGGAFDAETFDVQAVNHLLRANL